MKCTAGGLLLQQVLLRYVFLELLIRDNRIKAGIAFYFPFIDDSHRSRATFDEIIDKSFIPKKL